MKNNMTDYKKVYLASAEAFKAADVDKMMDYATDDFSWYNIEPEGPKLLADNKEAAKVGMRYLVQNPDYLKGHVDFAKAFGNIVVVVESDNVREDGEEIKKQRLSVYECKDGKLHRCFSLPIVNEDQAGAAE